MKCDHCGAAIKEAGAFCSHCGTRIQRPERAAASAPSATDPARYDLVAASPGLIAAQAHQPSPPSVAGIVAPLGMAVFGVFFLVFAGGMLFDDNSPGGGPPTAFKALFIVFPLVFIGIALGLAFKGMRFRAAPIEQQVLVVVDERVEVSGGGKNSSARTSYHATLQGRDGSRVEYQTYGWLAGRIAAGDIGLAFLKGGWLVDFLRLET
jgi:hypothetical protein